MSNKVMVVMGAQQSVILPAFRSGSVSASRRASSTKVFGMFSRSDIDKAVDAAANGQQRTVDGLLPGILSNPRTSREFQAKLFRLNRDNTKDATAINTVVLAAYGRFTSVEENEATYAAGKLVTSTIWMAGAEVKSRIFSIASTLVRLGTAEKRRIGAEIAAIMYTDMLATSSGAAETLANSMNNLKRHGNESEQAAAGHFFEKIENAVV